MLSSNSVDIAMVLAISAIVYVTSALCHEGLGHGLACLLVGGKPEAVSTSWFACDPSGFGPWAARAVAAGGTIANLLLGSVFLALLYEFSPRSGSWYYFLWLGTAVNLFMGGGYLMTSPLFGFGDWDEFVKGLHPEIVWRISLAIIGALISFGALVFLVKHAEPLLGSDLKERTRRARVLCWVPYLAAGGGLMTVSALFNSGGAIYLVSSALATLGGTVFLPWLTTWIKHPQSLVSSDALPILRSWGWLAAGCVAAVCSLVVFGPGVSFHSD
jgi:hypothetical protein